MSHECPTCGDEFDSSGQMRKHHAHKHGSKIRDSAICTYCDEEFPVINIGDANKYCSRGCFRSDLFQEGDIDIDPAEYPTDVDELLTVLYDEEGRNVHETYRAQCIVLGYDDRLYKREVMERLREMGLMRQRTWKDLLESDPSDVGTAKPEGDESYKQYYSSA